MGWGHGILRTQLFQASCNAGPGAPGDRELAWCLEIIGTSLCFHRWVSENTIFLYFLLFHFTFVSQPIGIWLWHLESYYSLLWSPTDSHLVEEYTFNSGFGLCHSCHSSSLDPFHVALVTKQSLYHHSPSPPPWFLQLGHQGGFSGSLLHSLISVFTFQELVSLPLVIASISIWFHGSN